MKRLAFTLPLVLLLLSARPGRAADDTALVIAHGTLVFEDDFNRKETSPEKEDVGNGWTTNSGTRAKNAKQASLENGALHVIKAPVADHSVSVRHEAAFQDGAVRLRFKLAEGEDLGLDFVDPGLKTVHSGHLCMTKVSLKDLTLTDQKTGSMASAIHERIEAKDKSPEIVALLKTKTINFPLQLKADEWHTLLIVIEGDTMRATVDEKPVGQFKSEGIAHPTKKGIILAVNKAAWVDDVKVWSLPPATTSATR